jgi:hypothetical protein
MDKSGPKLDPTLEFVQHSFLLVCPYVNFEDLGHAHKVGGRLCRLISHFESQIFGEIEEFIENQFQIGERARCLEGAFRDRNIPSITL